MYVASDGCVNSSTCSFTISVQDFVSPVAACDQTTTVALGDDDPLDCYTPGNSCKGAGVTWVSAKVFDDGSNDKCSKIKLTVRRMAPYSTCIDNLNACEKAIATAAEIIAKAKQANESEFKRLETELKREIGRLSVQAAMRVSGKILTAEDQKRLAEETNSQLAA